MKKRPDETTKNVAGEADSSAQRPPGLHEGLYTIEELADACAVFTTYREIVLVALKLAGKNEATLQEAKQLIHAFQNQEVT